MKRTFVKSTPPPDVITESMILERSNPLIAFEGAGSIGYGFLIPDRYYGGSSNADRRYMARSVRNFGIGNGWMEPSAMTKDIPKRMTLSEWLKWLSVDCSFTIYVFDTEKELFTWLAEKSI